MAKTKFKIKLTGLEIEFEGERDEVPAVANTMRNQLTEILSAPAALTSSKSSNSSALLGQEKEVVEVQASTNKVSRSKNSSNGRSSTRKNKEPAIDWRHDASKWGTPSQGWNPTKKSIWLLYVVEQELGQTDITVSQIATTFNKHFKQSGKVQASNVSRDLSKAKVKQPIHVQEDTTQDPSKWYLTVSGKDYAADLVKEALGINQADQ